MPEFDYGDQIYDAMSSTTANQLQVLQNSCLRVCTKANKRTPISELHSIAGVPKLDTRRRVHTCNLVQKGVKGHLSTGVKHMFSYVAESNKVATRANVNCKLRLPKCRLKQSEGNVAVRGARYLNDLPVDLRMEEDVAKFKNQVKTYYYGN